MGIEFGLLVFGILTGITYANSDKNTRGAIKMYILFIVVTIIVALILFQILKAII